MYNADSLRFQYGKRKVSKYDQKMAIDVDFASQ